MNMYQEQMHAVYKPLPFSEQKRLHWHMKRGCEKSRQKLIKSVLPMVVNMAKRFKAMRPDIPIEDFVQEGNLGAMRGVDLFNPHKGRVTTICGWHARQRMGRLCRVDGVIKLPNGRYPGVLFDQASTIATARNPREYDWRAHDTPPEYDEVVIPEDFGINSTELKAAFSKLSIMECQVIEYRHQGLHWRKVGLKINRTKQNALQIYNKAIDKLRKELL